MVRVKINLTAEVFENGDVRLRHECREAEAGCEIGLFGVPGRELTDKECRDILQQLAGFVLSRWEQEVKAARKAATKKPKK